MWISEELARFPNITAQIFVTLKFDVIVYVCCNTELKYRVEDGNTCYGNIENNVLSLNSFWRGERILFIDRFKHS